MIVDDDEDADARASSTGSAAPQPRAPAALAISPGIIASLLDLTERRLQQLVAEGWIPRPQRGQYNLRESVRGYVRYLKQHQRDNTRGAETSRLARAQAVKVEMENFRRMGDLAVWPMVDDLTQGFVQEVKTAHEGLPGRLSSELATITEPPQVYLRLQTELRRIDDLLADYLEKRAESFEAMPEPGRTDPAGPPHESGRMGEEESDHAGGLP